MVSGATELACLETTDLTPLIGTEVKADVETLVGGQYAKQIRELLARRGVLVFRELNMTDEEQKAFTLTLGELMRQRDKDFLNISLDKSVEPVAEYLRATFFWHIDMTRVDVPNLATLLSARVLPDHGGETEFANTYVAWEELPKDEQRRYEGLKVLHTHQASQRMFTPEPTLAQVEGWLGDAKRVQPLVWSHRSGRKSLVLGASADHIVGKNPDESLWILTYLREWATQSRFVYRHDWKVGDLVIWDNTGTMHRALPYRADSGRLMRRSIIMGEEPIA